MIHGLLIALSVLPPLATFLLSYHMARNGLEVLGRPPGSRQLFITAKVSLTVLFLLLIAASIFPGFFLLIPGVIQRYIPDVQKLMAGIFLLAGNLLYLSACATLGIFTCSGLPKSPYVLRTDGVYRISRNPMYTSYIFFQAACLLLVPGPIVAVLAIVCAFMHHRIVLKEEKYLLETFPDIFPGYRKQVGRYL